MNIARVLRPVARVEPSEVATACAMTLVAFVLMSGYYLLNAEAGQALMLLVVVRVYGAIARRVGRLRLLAIVYLFFASNMVVFAALARMKLHIGLAFFLWVGIFSYTSVAQFWAFAADLYDEEQGKRLFALVGVGSAVGSVAGSALARSMVARGPHVLMLGAAVLVSSCVALLAWVERRARRDGMPGGRRGARADDEEPVARETPLQLLLHDRYLVLIGALTLLLNCVSGLGDYVLDRTLLSRVAGAAAAGTSPETFVGAFKASFFAWYNGLAVLLQLFAVSRVLTRYGVRTALLVLPVVALLGYGTFLALPLLAVIRAAVIANRALDYSLTNTSRHALFLVASRAEKYVGKTLVDTVGARSGDLVSAAVVWLAARAGVRADWLAGVCVVLACAWMAVVLAIGAENLRRARSLRT